LAGWWFAPKVAGFGIDGWSAFDEHILDKKTECFSHAALCTFRAASSQGPSLTHPLAGVLICCSPRAACLDGVRRGRGPRSQRVSTRTVKGSSSQQIA
jgi:hypothetical protein